MFRKNKGRMAEDEAEKFIKNQGLKVIDRNFRSKFGEIDIVALDGDTLVFVEVRSVSSLQFGHPEESITDAKKKKLLNTAWAFINRNRKFTDNFRYRFDFVGIINKGKEIEIKWIRNIIENQ